MSRPLNIDDLRVWKLGCQFEDGVLDLLEHSPRAVRDAKFYGQLSDAAASVSSNIAEGFYRYNAREFARFLRYSRGSLAEAERRLQAGVRKGYWPQASVDPLLVISATLGPSLSAFHRYLHDASARTRDASQRERSK